MSRTERLQVQLVTVSLMTRHGKKQYVTLPKTPRINTDNKSTVKICRTSRD